MRWIRCHFHLTERTNVFAFVVLGSLPHKIHQIVFQKHILERTFFLLFVLTLIVSYVCFFVLFVFAFEFRLIAIIGKVLCCFPVLFSD